MSPSTDGPGQKGTFSHLQLSVSKKYLRPASRRSLLLLGCLGVAAVLAYTLFDFTFRRAAFVSNGPLSSNHANLEQDCAACHDPVTSVTNEKCSVCHEKHGDRLGVYTYAAHYVYRSNDFQRLVPSEKETACFSCHGEHTGRESEITSVPDSLCTACHAFGSFNSEHPQFDFAATNEEAARLGFQHIHHVREVMKREALVDLEKACLYCHNPQPDGRSFKPISFDSHCDTCHLKTTTATPALPIERDGELGVATLEAIQQNPTPGTRWAYFTDPNEFRRTGPYVRKSPVYHQDPWILENLRRLRRRRFPDAGLADLLRASTDVPPSELRSLYEEAVETLRQYVAELRSRPEPQVQAELREIEAQLQEVERQLRDPYTPIDETEFLLALERAGEVLGPEDLEELNLVVDDLTEPCRTCHVVERATIARVQTDQRVLWRAEFDHRAHILQRRCLDCHTDIPVQEHLAGTAKVDPSIDRAAIQNIPRIDTCRTCHNPEVASNRCVTCHYFHPNKSQRSELLLYLD